jgi:hypothetical protein
MIGNLSPELRVLSEKLNKMLSWLGHETSFGALFAFPACGVVNSAKGSI